MSRAVGFARSVLDPRAWVGLLRLVHYYNYAHVSPRRRLRLGAGVQLSPTATFRNPERVRIGARTHVGERCSLWAGDSSGSITIGQDCLLAPDVYVTASDYSAATGATLMSQPKRERDVVVGDDVWLGARVVVVAGVTIGDGCVVGAGSVVTRSLPPGSVAAGVPARVLRSREPAGAGVAP